MIKKEPLNKVGIEGMYLHIIKSIYDKSTAYIIFNNEKLKVLFLRSETIKRYPLLPLLINIELKV